MEMELEIQKLPQQQKLQQHQQQKLQQHQQKHLLVGLSVIFCDCSFICSLIWIEFIYCLVWSNNFNINKSLKWSVCVALSEFRLQLLHIKKIMARKQWHLCVSPNLSGIPDGDQWTPPAEWNTGLPSLHLNLNDATPYLVLGPSALHIPTNVRSEEIFGMKHIQFCFWAKKENSCIS